MSLELLTALQEAAETARIDRDRLALEVEEAQSLAMANADRFATAQGQFVERTHEVRAYEKLIAQFRPVSVSPPPMMDEYWPRDAADYGLTI